MSVTYVRKYRDDLYKVVSLHNPPPSFRRKPDPSNLSHHSESKLRNSLSRARSKVYELAICNDWDYFVTFTFDSNKVLDRYDLNSTVSTLRKWINNYNSRNGLSIKYVLIPEMHHDGAWHVHGLLSGLPLFDVSANLNGYPTWLSAANRFGFISLDRIRNPRACAAYMVKYITKDLSRSVSHLGAHVYYASKRLRRSFSVCITFPIILSHPDFSNEYCSISWLSDPRDIYKIAHTPDFLFVWDIMNNLYNTKLEVPKNEI